MPIGTNIKTIADKKGVSILDIIKGTGISQSYFYELLRNEKENPSLLITKKIADFLGITVDQLINMEVKNENID
ncbi:helix-turn-helix transcriptional regulator [Clostridium estertheticum]|uniref:helix-turn-helix domain-containing protein n=1 Tax=Clostridium estertheticum TaxID=238834 RepID=UPI001CF1B5D7|nr:helix-turn-helix transcriptional regulator [Clostridium estertheticum]MCB2309020.1 helix-turn-helix transcriptional regulator [Clostridium estertheticum]MCB2346846.1 helix-turn-helix transcriptional regulator [Clostridium estertheticum]MCB2351842.1 helix-turn-helix transcriptional regulator [Clostridium estertheticum]WAG48445.1 helix-turn-helix transcriptional regulator [Clostridium estertheticum]